MLHNQKQTMIQGFLKNILTFLSYEICKQIKLLNIITFSHQGEFYHL